MLADDAFEVVLPATAGAASFADEHAVQAPAAARRTATSERSGADGLQLAIALAGLAIVAVGMVAALVGISSL